MNVLLLVVCSVIAMSITSPGYVSFAEPNGTERSEVDALKFIKRNLTDPYNNLESWDREGDPCKSNWNGVFCNVTGGDLHITELRLMNMNLSGTLAPQLGLLSQLTILNFMWNKINGTIPKEIGNITSLRLLLLSGNLLTGSLPEEIGHLPNLKRLQIDENQITGPIPKSFAHLSQVVHLHMNNNSLSGQIPTELRGLQELVHFLVDNNNLSGDLPPEIAEMRSLKILQLDNNNFSGSSIPDTYVKMSTLIKLSLRNCSLQGTMPDLSMLPQLKYLDLSWNQLNGSIPDKKLPINITTIVLSNNLLNGPIPGNFSGLQKLQKLSLENNNLSGSVPSSIWQNTDLSANGCLILNFQNNSLEYIPDNFDPPENVKVLLYENPVCNTTSQYNVARFCKPENECLPPGPGNSTNSSTSCNPCKTDKKYEYNPRSDDPCLCSVPIGVGFRLKSPGISYFPPYDYVFKTDLTTQLNLSLGQLYINSYIWEPGPRLNMNLKLFPNNTELYDDEEVSRLKDALSSWAITLFDDFGPFELRNLTYDKPEVWLSRGSFVRILIGAIAGAAIISVIVTVLVMRWCRTYQALSRNRPLSRTTIKIDGVRCFTLEEMALATNQFSYSNQIGQGGYGKVFKGTLVDGTVVAIKRAQEGSFQGSQEFSTELELLSRLHHRNLVSLVGYCNENNEQMLVYEFISNGSLRDRLFAKFEEPLSFSRRLHIALGAARGILYLHTEADPPIFHRDIKASNILLDHRFMAKVSDFGLSRLAPVPDVKGIAPNHVSTVVKGTPGYLDPEYFLTRQLTAKSDVYSIGVVFLELLTGLPPIFNGKNLIRQVNAVCQSGSIFSMIDTGMEDCTPICVERFVKLALSCCHDEPDNRPSMSEVVKELESIIQMMPGDTSELGPEFMESSHSLISPYVFSDFSSSNIASTGVSNFTPR